MAQTLRQYSDIINKKINISFFAPKKDIYAINAAVFPTKTLQLKNKIAHITNILRIKLLPENLKSNDKIIA